MYCQQRGNRSFNNRGNRRRGGSQFHQPAWDQETGYNFNFIRNDYQAGAYNRGGSRGNQRSNSGPSAGEPKAQTEVQAELPLPQILSNTESTEQNDPLFMEEFAPEPGTELHPWGGLKTFTPSCIGFIEVVEQVYTELTSKGGEFGRRISEAVFTYYCAVGLYARLLFIHQKNGFLTSPQERHFIDHIKELDPVFPNLIGRYINGFGNTTSKGGMKLTMELFPRDEYVSAGGCPGWWGRMDENTHIKYEGFVNVAMCAYRIIKDLDISANHALDPNFQLPPLIVPEDVGGYAPGLPTENLLGYKPAVILRDEALHFIRSAGIHGGAMPNFASSNEAISYNVALMTSVMEYLERNQIMNLSTLNFTNNGSTAQIPWHEPMLGQRYVPESLTIQRRERLIQYSSEQCGSKVGSAGSAFIYRYYKRVELFADGEEVVAGVATKAKVRRDHAGVQARPRHQVTGELNVYNNWSAYYWDDYANVPMKWRLNANFYYETMAHPLNYKNFSSVPYIVGLTHQCVNA